jgi:GT2 family glycosyltransferase
MANIKERLGQVKTLSLHPCHQVRSDAGGGWTSLGDDPQFELVADGQVLEPGWYGIQVKFVVPDDGAVVDPVLYIDYGAGYAEDAQVQLRVLDRGGHLFGAVFQAPDRIHHLRLDPMATPGSFELADPVLELLDPQYAASRMNEPAVRFAMTDTKLRPLNQLQPEERGWWQAVGDDPQFELLVADHECDPGWHVIEVALEVPHNQEAATPSLYIDYGLGYSDQNLVKLAPMGDDRTLFSAVFQALERVVRLRFDPLAEPGRFRLAGFAFERIGPLRASLRMINELSETRPYAATPNRLRLLRDWIRSLPRQGIRGAAEHLATCYQEKKKEVLANNFAGWVQRYDTLHDEDRKAIRAAVKSLPKHPLISVVMPTYNTPEKWLRRCIDSVREQIYPHWELCIADDASPEPHVRETLETYARLDPRIKFEVRRENGHISHCSNTALSLATGEFVALLDHDDELPPHALYMVAEVINRHPQVGLIFSDEDKIDEKGVRFDPYFKPDWSADLFRGHNMISHLGVYKTSLLRELGGFRAGYEGSQDYDLALRVTERLTRDQIVHIPHVLYHWRAIKGSTALGMSEKNYAHTASIRALQDHLRRIGLPGDFEEMEGVPGNLSFKPRVDGQPRVSIIIPTRDGLDYLKRCIESIRSKSSYRNYEILIVDNQSSEPGTLEYLASQERLPDTRVIAYDKPFNYSDLNNKAAKQASGELLLFLNNDTEVITISWLEEMIGLAQRKDVGAVGCMLYYPEDDKVQHAGVVLGLGPAGVAGHAYHLQQRGYPGQMCRMRLTQELSAVTAACMMMRKEVFERVGGFDPGLRVAFNDVDLCLRVRGQGMAIVWTPRAELYHYESRTRGSDEKPEHKARFDQECAVLKERWGDQLVDDPFFNPNLRLDHAWYLFGPPRRPYPWRA